MEVMDGRTDWERERERGEGEKGKMRERKDVWVGFERNERKEKRRSKQQNYAQPSLRTVNLMLFREIRLVDKWKTEKEKGEKKKKRIAYAHITLICMFSWPAHTHTAYRMTFQQQKCDLSSSIWCEITFKSSRKIESPRHRTHTHPETATFMHQCVYKLGCGMDGSRCAS